LAAGTCALILVMPAQLFADGPGGLADERILDPGTLRIQSIDMSVTAFSQYGHGYQSQAGPVLGPGSERVTIFEPQEAIVFTQGDRLTYRLWVPVDLVTAASPNSIGAPDLRTEASRLVTSTSVDVGATYKKDRALEVSARMGVHNETWWFRSVTSGLGIRTSFADDASVVSANVLAVADWFDVIGINGYDSGQHTTRAATTGAASFTQVLTPTTVALVNYGITVMEGTLGNTWNSVPLANGTRGPELLPTSRTRHALVVRASQWLPWNGALRLYYRFYADDWGIVANSVEAQLMQRLSRQLYIGAYYRFHEQTGASFFTTLAPVDSTLCVADSDLAPFDSQTVGGKAVLDIPLSGSVRSVHFELAVERYVRTNDLQIDIVSWATGLRF
jgi:hypothetical protein